MKFLLLLTFFSCSSFFKNPNKITVPVTVMFDTKECGDVSVDRIDVGRKYESLKGYGGSDQMIFDQPNTTFVKKIFSAPVSGNKAQFELNIYPEELPEYLICPPIMDEDFSPHNCFMPIGHIPEDVKISISFYGNDCTHYQN